MDTQIAVTPRDRRRTIIRTLEVLTMLFYDLLVIFTICSGFAFTIPGFPSIGLVCSLVGVTILLHSFLRAWYYDCGLIKAGWVTTKRFVTLVFTAALVVLYRLTNWDWVLFLNWISVIVIYCYRLTMPGFGYGQRTRFVQVRRALR